jgi:carbon monoxide dehydrogenase subunit G
MGKVTASATGTVPAPPEQVLNFLSDLSSRSKILTGNYTAITVEPDNVLAYHFSAANRERDYRLKSALDAGTLTEKDELSSFVNTWQVVPAGTGSTVTLTGSWDGAGGIGGIFEGLFAPLGLKRIYGEVLTNLSRVLA